MKREKAKMKSEKQVNIKEVKRETLNVKRIICVFLFTIHLSLFTGSMAQAIEQFTIETKLINFIKQFYNDREDVHIKFNNFPDSLKEKTRVRHIDFVKIPDSAGNGLCLVEIDGKNSRTKNVYVSFKVQNKKRFFVLKQNAKKGEVIGPRDLLIKDTYMTDNGTIYPASIEEIVGKALKKETSAGTAITYQILEDSFVVQRGMTVNIVAENKKLMVQSQGRTLEKGRIGDVIRVKNIASDKEILGRVVGSSTVKVDL